MADERRRRRRGRAGKGARQGRLDFPSGWGGRRKGAGRRPKGARAGVSHRARPRLGSRFPVHVTLRLREGLPTLRRRAEHGVLVAAFGAGCERGGFRLVHYSVQANHLHLIVEGAGRRALSRGLQGLAVRVARGLNGLWRRAGSVFADRYHEHVLKTPREVAHALRYVLCNARKHGGWSSRLRPDPYSSSLVFDGWRDFTPPSAAAGPVARARTWLLRKGWRRHGLLRLDAVPGG
jgi:putative transposase